MQIPEFNKLLAEAKQGNPCKIFASKVHPNPRLYKYYWWIFWAGSPCEGKAFLTTPYRLSMRKAFILKAELDAADEPYWLYNIHLPRFDPEYMPFDPNAERWRDVEWAVAFAEDIDEVYLGFK